MTRGVEGVALTQIGASKDWSGIIGDEQWVFARKPGRTWQGFTWDHLTGTPRHRSLGNAVHWVQTHQAEIGDKLRVRRAARTRMVDPT
jgi:hypothetical protein